MKAMLILICLLFQINIFSEEVSAISLEDLVPFLGASPIDEANKDGLKKVKFLSVMPGYPAAIAGIQQGDYIISFNEIPIDNVYSLISAQRSSMKIALTGKPISCTINRDNRIIELIVPMLIVHKKSLSDLLNFKLNKKE